MVISRRVEGISRKVSQYIYFEREFWVPATPPILLLGSAPLLIACLYLAISSSLCSITQLPFVVDHQLVPLPDGYVHYLPLGKLVNREYVDFWKNLHHWQKFYTPVGSDGSDKFYF